MASDLFRLMGTRVPTEMPLAGARVDVRTMRALLREEAAARKMHVRRRERKHLLPRQTEAANARFQTESSVCGSFAAADAAGLQRRLRSRHEEFSRQVRSSSNASVDALPPIDRLGSIHLHRLSPSAHCIRSQDQLHACSALVPRQSQPRLVRVPEPRSSIMISQIREEEEGSAAAPPGPPAAGRPPRVGRQAGGSLAAQAPAASSRVGLPTLTLRVVTHHHAARPPIPDAVYEPPPSERLQHHSERMQQRHVEERRQEEVEQRQMVLRLRAAREREVAEEGRRIEQLRARNATLGAVDPNAANLMLSSYLKARGRGDRTAALMTSWAPPGKLKKSCAPFFILASQVLT